MTPRPAPKTLRDGWKQQGSEDIELIEGRVVMFPMSFERVKTPSWISGSCQKCNGTLGDVVWMAHSTPFCKWEMDWAYGEFIYCDSCGKAAVDAEAARSSEEKAKLAKRLRAYVEAPYEDIQPVLDIIAELEGGA